MTTPAEFRPTLQVVRISKENLMAKLKVNREKHIQDFNTALEGFRVEVKKQLDETLAKFIANNTAFDDEGVTVYEQPPQNHASDYDQVIMSLDLSMDTQFYLTTQEISQYIMDNWSWKQGFTTSVTKYSNNVR